MKTVAALILLSTVPVSADISNLSWLSGCWAYDGKDAGSGEYWMPPAGNTMLAVSRTVRGSKTVSFEYLRIETTPSGSLALFAAPSGQIPSRFDMKSMTTGEVVFENADHDFPQRIVYRMLGEDALLGRIEGKSDGRDLVIDFPMTAIDCENLGL